MSANLNISNLEEIREVLVRSGKVGLYRDALKPFGLPTPLWHGGADATIVNATGPTEVLENSPEDQVAVIGAGMRLSEIQRALEGSGQKLPLGPALPDWTLGESLALNLPHGLEAQYGSWREWVLGLTVVLADGRVAKLGSKAVKNVAGYDAHKLFIGARGTLGVVWEVILRTYPIRAVRPSAWQGSPRFTPTLDGGGFIQRVLPSDFEQALKSAGDKLLAHDSASSTLWVSGLTQRFTEDWVLGAHQGWDNLRIESDVVRRLMLRAQDEFDPERKLNPGEFGLEDGRG